MSWRDEAACRGHNTSLFFPRDPHDDYEEGEPKRRETRRMYRQAIRICNSCPVKQECLDYALDFPEIYGMWGGLTRPERANILRERRKEAREK
jgi:WhiB family transcriptional regulator, redox-sensing transcriptional regulator